jgi:enoyl-CoA hydratase/carnithine racemase
MMNSILKCELFSLEKCEGRRREGLIRFISYLQGIFNFPEKISIPVIASITGHCIGGALDLITACDLRYCTKDASFCIKETDLAIVISKKIFFLKLLRPKS